MTKPCHDSACRGLPRFDPHTPRLSHRLAAGRFAYLRQPRPTSPLNTVPRDGGNRPGLRPTFEESMCQSLSVPCRGARSQPCATAPAETTCSPTSDGLSAQPGATNGLVSEVRRATASWGTGRRTRVHRLAWEIANRRLVPAGAVVRHSCDNPPCCNPTHLSVGSNADNTMDSIRRGRRRTVLRGLPQSADECVNGHDLTAPNALLLAVTPKGRQRAWCRECRRIWDKAYNSRRTSARPRNLGRSAR
jgi:HNH endonuclease